MRKQNSFWHHKNDTINNFKFQQNEIDANNPHPISKTKVLIKKCLTLILWLPLIAFGLIIVHYCTQRFELSTEIFEFVSEALNNFLELPCSLNDIVYYFWYNIKT